MRLCALAASLLLAACSAASAETTDPADETGGEDAEDGAATKGTASAKPPADSESSVLHFSPAREFSGFDGVHPFKVPIAVYGAKDADVSVTPDDPGSATVSRVKLTNADPLADSGIYFMVEVKRTGTIKLTAKAGSRTAAATISAAAYDPARWELGRARYESAGSTGEAACQSCHVDGRAIDHSPAALASVADIDVGRIMTLGVKTSRTAIATGCTDCSEGAQKHQWTLSDDERRGLTTYLRSLEPRGFE